MGPEIWIVVGVAAIILGPSQIPKLARSIGGAKREIQDSLEGKGDDDPKPETKPDAPTDEKKPSAE